MRYVSSSLKGSFPEKYLYVQSPKVYPVSLFFHESSVADVGHAMTFSSPLEGIKAVLRKPTKCILQVEDVEAINRRKDYRGGRN
jgi:hypothetical protein